MVELERISCDLLRTCRDAGGAFKQWVSRLNPCGQQEINRIFYYWPSCPLNIKACWLTALFEMFVDATGQ